MHAEVTCAQLEVPEGGEIQYSTNVISFQYDLGIIATYSCDSGYSLEGGDVERVCEHDGVSISGEWSGTAPECVGEPMSSCICCQFLVS